MPAKQSSFQIHDVFKPLALMPEVAGPVRVVDTVNFNEVIVISVDTEKLTVPYAIGYDRWIDMLDGGEVEKAPDPYLHLPSAPVGLPDGAAKRLKQVIEATTTLSQKPGLLHRRTTLSSEIARVAGNMGLGQKCVKRWFLLWLKAGRNPAAVVSAFMDVEARELSGSQVAGKKRGPSSTKPELASSAPAHEVVDNITKAYQSYIKAQGMSWKSAYYEMLIKLYELPDGAVPIDAHSEVLLSPALIQKYRLPTWNQFRYLPFSQAGGARRGLTLRMPAFDAQGRGILQERTLDVAIPKGIRQGQQLRLAGQGGPGLGSGAAGDLYLEIEFKPHPRYRVEGRDLYVDLRLAPWEAALGAPVPIATPQGVIELTVPAGSTSGRKLRLKGRGIPGEPAGDLYAQLDIVLPPADSDASRQAYEALRAAAGPQFDPRRSS